MGKTWCKFNQLLFLQKKSWWQCYLNSFESILVTRFFIVCSIGPFGVRIHYYYCIEQSSLKSPNEWNQREWTIAFFIVEFQMKILSRECIQKKLLLSWLNSTHFQLSLEKKIKSQKAFLRILKLILSPSLMWTEHRDVL